MEIINYCWRLLALLKNKIIVVIVVVGEKESSKYFGVSIK